MRPALLALLLLGCGGPRAVVSSAADGVRAADDAIVGAYHAGPCPTEQDPVELQDCVDQLDQQTAIIRAAADLVRQGEALLDAWESEGAGAWPRWVEAMAASLRALAELAPHVPLLQRALEDIHEP
jgi:hypothetical protein